MRTQLAPLIVVKQEFPDFHANLIDNNENEENNNNFPQIKSENDCNNNQPEDLNSFIKKSKKIFFFLLVNPLTHSITPAPLTSDFRVLTND
jgi:hypothetical protein